MPRHAILAFGCERHGLSDELLPSADARIRIPMRAGVSSLNLATSVAAVLYGWSSRLDGGLNGSVIVPARSASITNTMPWRIGNGSPVYLTASSSISPAPARPRS